MSQQDYSSLVKTFEDYISAHQPEGIPDSLYAPMRYINELGGKRIRPVLLLMAYNLWHDDVSPALPAALAIEYFHNFSLMHDDIMDEAALRRGNESVHIRYGRNAAILSGDAMLIRCFELLLEAGRKNNTGAAMCTLMSGAAIAICEGQQMDIDFETRQMVTVEEYLEMIRKKTACLLGLSLQIGGLLAGADEVEKTALYKFGENIGMAFQIRDDYLDVFGDDQLTGKQVGGDILRGKKNFLFVRTGAQLSPKERDAFLTQYVLAGESSDPTAVMEYYRKLYIPDQVQKTESEYMAAALKNLDTLKKNNILMLQNLREKLADRSF